MLRSIFERMAKRDRTRRLLPIAVLCALLCALLLAGCGSEPTPEPEATEAPPSVYQVRFFFGEDLLQSQEVTEGQRPAQLELSLPGLTFSGWTDAAGNAARPERTAVTGDADYYAAVLPKLDNHVSYLFPDADGFLHPDDPLTYRALYEALHALVYPAAAEYLPELPVSDEAVPPEEFLDVLLTLFPAEKVDGAVPAERDGGTLARREAAAILNALLGRGRTETVTLRRDAVAAPDVSPAAPDYWDLVEASVSHIPDDWGESWQRCEIPARYAPGLLLLDGRLYCIGEDGAMLTDTESGGLAFGRDGVYTSGNAELDGYVVGILASIMRENPGADRLELLRAAYNYSRDSFTYLRKSPFDFGATGWEAEAAVEMFSTLYGNCYNYAAAFWSLARGLGYDAYAYSGTISEAPHGWVEITIDGTDYLFDPELEMANLVRGGYAASRFMLTRFAAGNFGVYLKKAS